MSSKYFIQLKAGTWIHGEFYDTSPITNFTVSDAVAVDTGLVDEKGNTLFRRPNPRGFGRDEEW